MKQTQDTLIVGLGSSHGDDQVGWRVADELQRLATGDPGVRVRLGLAPLDLLDWLTGIRRLYLCDAAQGDGEPGSLRRMAFRGADGILAVESLRLVSPRSRGSHDFGIAATLELASQLGRLPEQIVIHAVLGSRFCPGASLTREVERAIPAAVRTIWNEVTHARDVVDAIPAEPGRSDSRGSPGGIGDGNRN